MRRHKAQPVPQDGRCLLFLWVNQPPVSPPGTPAVAKLRPCLGKQMRQQLGFTRFQRACHFTTPGKQRQLHIARFRYRHRECDIAQECFFAAALGAQLSHTPPPDSQKAQTHQTPKQQVLCGLAGLSRTACFWAGQSDQAKSGAAHWAAVRPPHWT